MKAQCHNLTLTATSVVTNIFTMVLEPLINTIITMVQNVCLSEVHTYCKCKHFVYIVKTCKQHQF